MDEFISQEKAEQWINFIASFCSDTAGFSKEDWMDWRPRIKRAREVTENEELKHTASNTIAFFDQYYPKSK